MEEHALLDAIPREVLMYFAFVNLHITLARGREKDVHLYTASAFIACLRVWRICLYGVSMRYATLGDPNGPNKAYIMFGGLRAEV